jgi:hypothetical protein
MEEMVETDDHFIANQDQGFTAIREVRQGDSSGSLCWIAVLDILLYWTDPGDEVTHPANFPANGEDTVSETGDTDRGYEPTQIASYNRSAYADEFCGL